MSNFITVTTKDVSPFTGKPKVFAINVAHIVTVEPTMFDVAYSPDRAETIEGASILVHANDQHILEIFARDPFDHVMFRVGKAGGVIDVTQVEATS